MRVRFRIFLLCSFGLSALLACNPSDDGPVPIDPIVNQGCVITGMSVSPNFSNRLVFNYDGRNPYEMLIYNGVIRPESLSQTTALTYDNDLLTAVRTTDGNGELTGERRFRYQGGVLQEYTGEFYPETSVINRFFYNSNQSLTRWEDQFSQGGTEPSGFIREFTYNDGRGVVTAVHQHDNYAIESTYETSQTVNPLEGSMLLTLLSPILGLDDFFLSGQLITNKKDWSNGDLIREFSFEYELNGQGYPTKISRSVLLGHDVNVDVNLEFNFEYACAN